MAEVTFRGSILCVLEVWKCNFRGRRRESEVSVAVTLALGFSGCGLKGLESRNCLSGVLDVLAPMRLPA